jgi:hypothetical protein
MNVLVTSCRQISACDDELNRTDQVGHRNVWSCLLYQNQKVEIAIILWPVSAETINNTREQTISNPVMLHRRINWLIYMNKNIFSCVSDISNGYGECNLTDGLSYGRPVYPVGFSVPILWKIRNPFPVEQAREHAHFARYLTHTKST